jgi:hypothetical protein
MHTAPHITNFLQISVKYPGDQTVKDAAYWIHLVRRGGMPHVSLVMGLKTILAGH